jgi:hypothetical protein
MASVFAQGRYVGAILHRGPKGYEALGDGGTSHGLFLSQKEAAVALQQIAVIAVHALCKHETTIPCGGTS